MELTERHKAFPSWYEKLSYHISYRFLFVSSGLTLISLIKLKDSNEGMNEKISKI